MGTAFLKRKTGKAADENRHALILKRRTQAAFTLTSGGAVFIDATPGTLNDTVNQVPIVETGDRLDWLQVARDFILRNSDGR